MTGLRDDRSGQALLTFAFLLAITITMIALMLNNVIYTNNQAYIGFMDQTQYSDQSIRGAIAGQVAGAYEDSHGDPATFGSIMDDYVDRMNNATMTRGKYIEFTPLTVIPMPVSGPDVTYIATLSRLTIHGQDSEKTYLIETNYSYTDTIPAPTPVPIPGSAPASTIVRIGCNQTEFSRGGGATIVIEATNGATNMPASYIRVDLHTNIGTFEDFEANSISSVVTDINGKAMARLRSLDIGTMIVNASVGPDPDLSHKNLSGNLYMSCIELPFSGTCTHSITIEDPVVSHSSKTKAHTTFHTITISIPVTISASTYDLHDFAATAAIVDSTNLQLLSPSDIDDIYVSNLQGTASDTRYIMIKLNWINYPEPYSAEIDVEVSADCTTESGAYTGSRSLTVNGPPPP